MRRDNMFASLLAVAALSSIPGVSRASQQQGTINFYSLPTAGSAALVMNGSRTATPACATDQAWSIPDSTSAQRVVAAIITAKAMGKTVLVYGTGNCDTTQPTRELVAWIEFQ